MDTQLKGQCRSGHDLFTTMHLECQSFVALQACLTPKAFGLRLISTADWEAVLRLSGLVVSPACTLFSHHCYPPASQRNKHHPRIAATLKWKMKKRYSSRGVWSKKYGIWVQRMVLLTLLAACGWTWILVRALTSGVKFVACNSD